MDHSFGVPVDLPAGACGDALCRINYNNYGGPEGLYWTWQTFCVCLVTNIILATIKTRLRWTLISTDSWDMQHDPIDLGKIDHFCLETLGADKKLPVFWQFVILTVVIETKYAMKLTWNKNMLWSKVCLSYWHRVWGDKISLHTYICRTSTMKRAPVTGTCKLPFESCFFYHHFPAF